MKSVQLAPVNQVLLHVQEFQVRVTFLLELLDRWVDRVRQNLVNLRKLGVLLLDCVQRRELLLLVHFRASGFFDHTQDLEEM